MQNQPGDWLIDGAVVAAFLALYFRGFWVEGRALLPIAFAIVALGAITAPRNPGASCFFIYGAAFLGDVGRPARGGAMAAGDPRPSSSSRPSRST